MSDNLAAAQPAKLKELQSLFTEEAIEHHVLPIDDRTIERFDPKVAGRPDLMDGRTKLTVYPGMVYMSENAFINVKNASVDMVADVEVNGAKNHGVLLAQGGRFGGWAFWVDHGKPRYSYNFLGLEVFQVSADEAMTDGRWRSTTMPPKDVVLVAMCRCLSTARRLARARSARLTPMSFH
jgi:arylsulfatase